MNMNVNAIYRSFIMLVIGIALVFPLFGCLGSGDEGDTEPPVIISRSPDNHATDVPVNTQVHVVFNKSVINISNSTFYLTRLGSFGNIPATVSYDDASRTATLTPTEPLEWNTIYYVTITGDVRSRAGVALEAESWTFITASERDSIAPEIVEMSPAADFYVDINTEIYVVFSERVFNVSENTFYLLDNSTGQKVSAKVSYNQDALKATLQAGTLKEWTSYTLYVTDQIVDGAGNHLSIKQWTFTTNDTTNPSVVHKSPEGSNVPPNTLVSVIFSESINASTINKTTFSLFKKEAGNYIPVTNVTVTYNNATKTATLIPSSGLLPGTEYKVQLSADIRDYAQNTLSGGAQEWSFTTSSTPDTTPPTISDRFPGVNHDKVAKTTTVTVYFSEAVVGVGTSSFYVEKASDSQKINGSVVYYPSEKKAVFTPQNTLEEGVWYRVRLTSDIKDAANNSLSPESWQFKTLDETIPYVISKFPADGVGDVGVNVNIEVKFSESVGGVDANTFKVKNISLGSYVSGAVSYNDSTKTATFDPDSDLAYDTEFEVSLSTDIKDASGNPLQYTTWKFTTGSQPDTTPPTVVSPTYPDHTKYQTNIPVTAQVKVYFSEPVTGVGPQTLQLRKGDENGTLINTFVAYDSVSKCASVVPYENLEYSTIYTVVVKGGSGTEIKDLAGNKVASNIVWSFETVGDTTPPQVVQKVPSPGTQNVPGNGVEVKAYFSEEVKNVSTSTFILRQNFGTYSIVSSDVVYSYDPQTKTAVATLTPKSPITDLGEYKVELSDGITDVSKNANKLIPTSWTFAVIPADTTPPEVTYKNPNNGANNWSDGKITVIFSEDVKGVSATSFYVKDDTTSEILPSVVSYSSASFTATLTVSTTIPYERTFTAYLTNAIKDSAGNKLNPTSWSFSSPQDTIPPTVVSVYPPQGTNSYPINGEVRAIFSEDIQNYSSTNFYLTPSVSANITYDSQTKTLTLIPTVSLQGDTLYTVTIKGGTSGIKDKAKTPNSMTNDYTWSFRTQYIEDKTPPAIVAGSRDPAPGATGVPLTKIISVKFTEHVVNATTKVTLWKGSTQVASTVSYSSANFEAKIIPDEQLMHSTAYTVKIFGGPTGIKDAAGNYLPSDDTWSFTTEADTTPPTIIERYPLPGATGVPLQPVITVTFSEPVTGISGSSFYLTGTGVPTCYVMYDEATRTATLTPGSNLQNGTTYTVNLTTAIKDRANNSLATTWWTFTTNTLPEITNIATSTDGISFTTRADGATGVPHNTSHVRITFNRAMNPNKTWFELYEGASGSNTPSPAIPNKGIWSSGNTVITYPIVGKFRGNTQYQARLYGWGGSFEDPDGNVVNRSTYVGDGIFNFTTSADSTAPQVISTIPANNATVVGRDVGIIIIRFDEMMNQTRDSRITLTPSVTATRTGWIDAGRTVIFTIPQLAANTNYTVQLNTGTNSFQDLAGNNASYSFSFKTGSATGSSNIIAEGFENYNDPYFTSLRNVSTDTGGNWERKTTETAGNGTKLTPQEGSYLVKGAFWEWDFGLYADVVSISPMNFSTAGSYILTFKMFHERLYNQLDRLEVWVSEDGSNYVQVTAGALTSSAYRYDFSFGSDAPVWSTHYVDLSNYSGKSSVYLRLRAISAGELGGNVIIDDLKVTRY
ncbi:MAG: Ig-like domain-containing protein [Spirochaetes bacterium]|nr:Ig-like domain-containing protein [Spirochaetota bacterium]